MREVNNKDDLNRLADDLGKLTRGTHIKICGDITKNVSMTWNAYHQMQSTMRQAAALGAGGYAAFAASTITGPGALLVGAGAIINTWAQKSRMNKAKEAYGGMPFAPQVKSLIENSFEIIENNGGDMIISKK